VIPTCGRAPTLRRTIEALLQQDYDLTRVEIVVVCDGPDDATISLVRELARGARCGLRVIEQPRRGQGRARNRGIAAATGRVVVMLDDDIAAVPGLLSAHARHHDGPDDVVVTGALPMATIDAEPAHRRVVREWWDGELREVASPRHVATFRDFVTGNVSVPRVRLVEVGGFDEAFTGYGREDYELGLRLHRAGLRFVHEPRAIGVHHYDKAAIDWLRQFYSMGRADVIFARKHPASVDAVMGLSPFPRWPGIARAIPWLEQFVLARSDRGGRVWGISAALTQGAHYWAGIEAEARDARELAWLAAAHRRMREARLRAERAQRGESIVRRLWRRATGVLQSRALTRTVARALGRSGLR
jgi:GT2 family glycosyltransferase